MGASHIEKIDLPALRAALETLEAHEELLIASIKDEARGFVGAIGAEGVHDRFVSALIHVIDDSFRSDATRGGS